MSEGPDARQRLIAALGTLIDYGVVLADADGRLESLSPLAARLGRGVGAGDPHGAWAQALGLHEQDGVTPVSSERAPVARALAGEAVDGVELCAKAAEPPAWLRISARPIHRDSGPVVGALVVFDDVSAARHANEQRQHASKLEAVGRLAGGVAHDFNNLLTAVIGYAELALIKLPPQDPLRRDLSEIKKAGERAATLTQQLLAFGRKQRLELRVLSMNDLLLETEQLLRRLLTAQFDLSFSLDSRLGNARLDADQFTQVVMNLVINARDAMPQGGKLTIETKSVTLDADYARTRPDVVPGSYVMLAVSDTGVGMDKPTLARIFEPFFTTKERGKGSGLGLPTVYGIVKQCQGHVAVYSEPGQGSVFKVYFPRVSTAAQPRSTTSVRLPTKSRGTEVVLLVEDDDAVRPLARAALAEHGYTVLDASHGGEALLLAERFSGRIHLLLTDVILPQLGGKELYERLRVDRKDLAVLFMSGYTEDAIVHQGALDEGAHFLAKPFAPHELCRRVREVLDSQ